MLGLMVGGEPCPHAQRASCPGILWAPLVCERAAFALQGDLWTSGPLRTGDIVSRDRWGTSVFSAFGRAPAMPSH